MIIKDVDNFISNKITKISITFIFKMYKYVVYNVLFNGIKTLMIQPSIHQEINNLNS